MNSSPISTQIISISVHRLFESGEPTCTTTLPIHLEHCILITFILSSHIPHFTTGARYRSPYDRSTPRMRLSTQSSEGVPEVPKWWYWDTLGLFFLITVIEIERWPADIPVHSLTFAVAVPALYVVPWADWFRGTG